MARYLTPLWTSRAVRIGLLTLALATLAVGCTRNKPRAVVRGKVTLGAMTVSSGQVGFFTSDNRVSMAEIVDGKYEMKDAPVGEVKITVNPVKPPPVGFKTPPRPKDIGGMPADMGHGGEEKHGPSRVVPIPDKYKTVETTDLTFTVANTKDAQEYDIKLTP
jgi:hypothetical protein